MDGQELRRLRKAAGLTQAQLGKRIGLHRDFIGLMERGVQPIAERTRFFVSALEPDAPSVEMAPLPPLVTSDPMERIIERALQRAGIRYETDHGGGNASRLDFRLPDHDVEIEVKRFHSDRTGAQMARAPNVIVAQGEVAVRFLAEAIERLPRTSNGPAHRQERAGPDRGE